MFIKQHSGLYLSNHTRFSEQMHYLLGAYSSNFSNWIKARI